jgi:hypothetical protein
MQRGQAAERGGSWNNHQRNARCAYRNRNTPDNFNNNLGFRVFSHDLLYALPVKLACLQASRGRKSSQRCLTLTRKSRISN